MAAVGPTCALLAPGYNCPSGNTLFVNGGTAKVQGIEVFDLHMTDGKGFGAEPGTVLGHEYSDDAAAALIEVLANTGLATAR